MLFSICGKKVCSSEKHIITEVFCNRGNTVISGISEEMIRINLLLMVGYLSHGQCQKMSFEHLGTEHGLSQNSVFSIFEDKRGFMWFGTEEGLNRYDGYDFKVYKKDLGNSNSLSYSIIWPLYENSSDRFWVGTRGGGLNLFLREKEMFLRFQHHPDDPNSLSQDIVRDIAEDTQGNLLN